MSAIPCQHITHCDSCGGESEYFYRTIISGEKVYVCARHSRGLESRIVPIAEYTKPRTTEKI